MSRVNILYVITKLELGGAQAQLLSLIRRLDKERYAPFILTARTGVLLADALSIKGITLKESRYLERAINPLKDLLAAIEIYRFIRKHNIDIVHTHSSKAGILGRWAARLSKVKLILHSVHGWSFNDYQPFFLRRIYIWLERITAHFTHKLIVVSGFDLQKGLESRIGNESQYVLIRYGINYAEFEADKNTDNARKELGITPGDFVVAMVSCFKPQKSPQDFIKLAFLVNQNLAGVKFILVGDGGLREKINKLIFKFNLQKQVILTGWRRDIPRILRATDVFVLTSLWEGLPISALEAMASSRPVIATDTGGIREVIIGGETGFLVRPQDVQGMAEKLLMLLREEKLRKTIGQNARRALNSDFRIENMVSRTEGVYQGLIESRGLKYAS